MSERYRRAFINTFKIILSCKIPDRATQKYQCTNLYYYNKRNFENSARKLNDNISENIDFKRKRTLTEETQDKRRL